MSLSLQQPEPSPLSDLSAEYAVLGAVLIDANVLDEISFLEDRDFSVEINRLIYRVMRYLNEQDAPIDVLTVTQEFKKFNRVEEMGGASYLMKLHDATPTAGNAAYYAKIVRSAALRRRGLDVSSQIKALTYDHFESDEDYFAALEELVDELRPGQAAKMRSFAQSRKEYFEHIESSPGKLKTGFPQFDSWSQLWRGWLYILAGRPSVGKTAKALQMALGVARFNPGEGPVLIFSQEMGENEVKDRMVAAIAEVNYPRLINKGGEEGFTKDEWRRINEAYALIEKLPIFIQDSAGVTIEEIRATVKQFKKRYGKVALIVIDYLQIMEIPQKKSDTRAQAIGRVTRTAKNIARRHEVPIVMLSQLDRAVDDEEPKLRHLKESGSIEQDADVVEFLWYDPSNQPNPREKVIDSIFAKGRNVGTNRFRYEFQWWYQRYVEKEKGAMASGASNPKKNRK